MRRIAIGPANWLGDLVVAMDIATDLASQVGDEREHAARQEVSLDFRKPELVQPGRIGRREMQMHVRVLQQERAHGLGLMRRQIVGEPSDRRADVVELGQADSSTREEVCDALPSWSELL